MKNCLRSMASMQDYIICSLGKIFGFSILLSDKQKMWYTIKV